MVRFVFVVLMSLAASSPAMRGAVEFSGYILTGKTSWFLLSDPDKKTPTASIEVGHAYEGYVLSAYDSRTDEIRLQPQAGGNGTREMKLKLSAGAPRVVLSGAIDVGGDKIEVVRALFPIGEHTRIPLREGLVFSFRPTLAQDGSMKYAVMLEKYAKDGRKEVLSGPLVRVAPGTPFEGKVGDLQYRFRPQAP